MVLGLGVFTQWNAGELKLSPNSYNFVLREKLIKMGNVSEHVKRGIYLQKAQKNKTQNFNIEKQTKNAFGNLPPD